MSKITSNNLTAKIVALILAAILWLYVMNEQNPPIESSFTLPLEVRNGQTNLVVSDLPDTVRIKLRGPRSIIAGLLAKDMVAYIDVKGLAEGRNTVKINTQIPSSVELLEINPDKATIRIDTAVSRQLPIDIRLTGTATAGAAVGKVTSSHEKVTIEGPKTIVENVEQVYVLADVTNKNADFQAAIPLVPVNKSGKEVEGLTVFPDKVTISVVFSKEGVRKMVDIRPLIYGELAGGHVLRGITTDPTKIEVTGSAEQLEKLEFIYTEPINLSGINHDTKREVKLQAKEGLVISQQTVVVNIQVQPK
ncbi:YbbR domain-containing protein [Anaerospora hongkongensis]|uniref:YbbR domain-containing protein n=2 Tax=Anaerospora hongkongensis TaxID=244830 RepID=A0A4R1Q1R1_9FIRM|nr:CdaR family protein [Anaerospora hongkongensis]TCL39508.1 YbbR domain-containing protein [Anaerospora hongkongensis]